VVEPLGVALRRLRVAAHLTQEELAERAAISATAVAALERGRRRSPRMSTLRQIARALDVSPDELTSTLRTPGEQGLSSGDETRAAFEIPVLQRDEHDHDGVKHSEPKGAPGTLPRVVARHWATAFVGRKEELDDLTAAWEAKRRLTLVVGEPGVGKTRLLSELAWRAADDGATVTWGRCTEEHLGPYSPFVEIVRQLVGAIEEDDLAKLSGIGELTRLVPELDFDGDLTTRPTRGEAGTEQRLLFEAVGTLLEASAPVMCVLDDVQWADHPSLTLLHYLVADERLEGVSIVADARSNVPDAERAGRLAELGRDTTVMRLSLNGLDRPSLGGLVSDVIGMPVSDTLIGQIEQATDGNPFFAEEIAVHLIDADLVDLEGPKAVLRRQTQSLGVPGRVRETLARRLYSLPVGTLDLLRTGSVIGREFPVSVAALAVGLQGGDLLDAVDEVLLSGLVAESDPGVLVFSHALVQEAVRAQLSWARRADAHRRVALALEDRWHENPAVATDIARHWQAVVDVDPSVAPTAAIWAVRAGDIALAAAAADEAIARYEQASSLWAASTSGHADAVIRLGIALAHTGRADEADRRFTEGLHLAIALDDPRLLAKAAIGLGRRYPYWETDPVRVDALERALVGLDRAEETDELLRLTVSGLLVTHLVNGFESYEARRRDELALMLSSVADDPSTSDEVLLSIGQSRFLDSIEDPLTLGRVARRLHEVGDAHNDLRVIAGAQFAMAVSALDDGDLDRATSSIGHFRQSAERLGDPREQTLAGVALSTLAFIRGRYDEANSLSYQALAAGLATGDVNASLVHFAQTVLRGVDLGEAAEILPLLIEATDYQRIPAVAAGTVLCAAMTGEHDIATRGLARFVEEGIRSFPLGADRLATLAFLAHACWSLRDATCASVLVESLSAEAARTVRVGPFIGWWGPVAHHLGCMYEVSGDTDRAFEQLGLALDLEERMQATPFQARTEAALARVTSQDDMKGGRARAEALVASALESARTLGAKGISAEVEALVAQL
jgi:transcriptional regulator with XRE-family HTH domain/tetratricopeptide (TPR) repeat protein